MTMTAHYEYVHAGSTPSKPTVHHEGKGFHFKNTEKLANNR